MKKKRSEIVEQIMARISTPEYKEESERRRLEHKKSLTMNYQLGYYVGQEIVRRFLPTTSIEELGGLKRIKTTIAEYDEYKRLSEVWYSGTGSFHKTDITKEQNKKDWIALREYSDMIFRKYLPETVECQVGILNITDEEDFKKGLAWSLFDCDFSHYSTNVDDINIYDNKYSTVIELKLQLGDWKNIS